MEITTGVQLQQHLQAGGHVQLGEHGLESQSGISRLFQGIGDAFRGLTRAGREGLLERNTRLQDSMAALLREPDALPNLAETRLADTTVKGDAEKAILTRMAVGAMVRGDDPAVPGASDIPQEGRKTVQELVLKLLDSYPPADKSAAGLRAEAGRLLRGLLAMPGFAKACVSSFEVTPERAIQMQNTLRQTSEQSYREQKERLIDSDGFHDSYLLDARRDSVGSINGQPLRQAPLHPETRFLDKSGQPRPPRDQGLLEQLAELVPDKKIRGLVTMIASQAGIEGDLAMPLIGGLGPNPSDLLASRLELPPNIVREMPAHTLSIDSDGDTLRVTSRVTIQDKLIADSSHRSLVDLPGGFPVLSRNTYEVTVSIPLHQDLTDREVPDYTVSGFRHVQG